MSNSPSRSGHPRVVVLCTIVFLIVIGTVVGVRAGATSDPGADNQSPGPAFATDREDEGSDTARRELREVPLRTTAIRDPIGLHKTATLDKRLQVRITEVESVAGKARGHGEIAGPALRVTVRLANNTGRDLDLSGGTTDLTYGPDRTPGLRLSGPGVRPLPLSVAAGERVTGRYVFGVPRADRDRIDVTFNRAAPRPTVAFTGSVD